MQIDLARRLQVQLIDGDVLDYFGRDQARDPVERYNVILADSAPDFSRGDHSDERALFVHFDGVVLWEVRVRKELVVIVAFATENHTFHLVNDPLALVPLAEALDQITAHYEVKRVRSPVHLLQLIEQINSRDAWPILDLNWVDFDREAFRVELLDGELDHIQSVLGR